VKITRRLFINRRNGQGSITLPKKIIQKISDDLKIDQYPKEISLEIRSPKRLETKKIG
jgi:hypothetical protein